MWVYKDRDRVEHQLKNYLDMSKFPVIKGYDLSRPFDLDEFIASCLTTGFQASNLGLAHGLLKRVYADRQGVRVFLSFTGNMVSSGVRDIITFMVRHKLVDGIVTTAAALEEDVMKCVLPFHLGTFDIKGETLLNECIGRIGNVFVPADRYLYLERFLNRTFPVLAAMDYPCTSDVARIIGEQVKGDELTKKRHQESFLYWAYKNNIPVFVPGITDGALGDMSVFYRQKDKGLHIDVAQDNERLTRLFMDAEKAAGIVLGGGIAKHFLLNAAIFRDGLDYAVYVTTADGYDGSDSGGNQEEAVSWAKIRPGAERVKVHADATLVFPLLAASLFGKR